MLQVRCGWDVQGTSCGDNVAQRDTNFARDVANEKALVPEVLQMRGEYLCPGCGKEGIFPGVLLLSFLTGNAPIILYRTRIYEYGTILVYLFYLSFYI